MNSLHASHPCRRSCRLRTAFRVLINWYVNYFRHDTMQCEAFSCCYGNVTYRSEDMSPAYSGRDENSSVWHVSALNQLQQLPGKIFRTWSRLVSYYMITFHLRWGITGLTTRCTSVHDTLIFHWVVEEIPNYHAIRRFTTVHSLYISWLEVRTYV